MLFYFVNIYLLKAFFQKNKLPLRALLIHLDFKFCTDAFGSCCFVGCKAKIESSVFQHGLFVALQSMEPEVPLQSQGLSSGVEQVVRVVYINS